MKYLTATFALALGAVATVAGAADLGQAYRNWGQCNSALASVINNDWKNQKAGDSSLTGLGNSYAAQLACVKVGDYYYIMPHA